LVDRERAALNTGDILHGIQIAVMLATLGVFYQQMNDGLAQIRNLEGQVVRIEHYLSSKDPHYWEHTAGH
jgi:hypothetical protein